MGYCETCSTINSEPSRDQEIGYQKEFPDFEDSLWTKVVELHIWSKKLFLTPLSSFLYSALYLISTGTTAIILYEKVGILHRHLDKRS